MSISSSTIKQIILPKYLNKFELLQVKTDYSCIKTLSANEIVISSCDTDINFGKNNIFELSISYCSGKIILPPNLHKLYIC